MTALQQFTANIDASDRLVAMYRELRRVRNLGARGRLPAEHQDLLWLPRSAVVAAISALDTYVHDIVKQRLGAMFAPGRALPEALAEVLSSQFPIRNAATFRQAVPVLMAQDSVALLLKKLEENHLQFQSFQAPDKVHEAFRLIGVEPVFERVSDLWPGPNTTAADIRRRLSGFVVRRNQIAHEGDREVNGQPRPMQPEYAVECKEFVENLVQRLHQVANAA